MKAISFDDMEDRDNRIAELTAEIAAMRAQFEQFAKDIAFKLDIPYTPPVTNGECVYLKALEGLKERLAAAEKKFTEEREQAEWLQACWQPPDIGEGK